MNVRFLATGALALGFGVAAQASDVTQYTDFGSYDAALGGVHDHFIDFETDSDGNGIGGLIGDADGNGTGDVLGGIFSNKVTFSSPDAGGFGSYVNIADIGGAIGHEIGPMGGWSGTLRIDFDSKMTAVAWTGIDLESGSLISFYNGGTLVASDVWINTAGTFDFGGFTLGDGKAFDRVEIVGDFYAIDALYGTRVIPVPAALAAFAGLGLLGRRRRRD